MLSSVFFVSVGLCQWLLPSLASGSSGWTVKPSPEMVAWSNLEIGAMVSWNMATMVNTQGCAAGMSRVPPISAFDLAQNVSMTDWAKTLKSFGARYAVFTAKHNCGFALWPSKASLPSASFNYNYTIEYSSLKGRDLVAEFVDAMRQHGIKPGLYYSLGNNFYLNILDRKRAGEPKEGQVQLSMEQYYDVVQQQLKELWTNYGQLVEIWFDGGAPEALRPPLKVLFEETQSQAVGFQGYGITSNTVRWPRTETGKPTEAMWSLTNATGSPSTGGSYWYPPECDTTLQQGDNWFFTSAVGMRSAEEMREVYYDSVGNNCQLLLNFAPDARGEITAEQRIAYAELGAFMHNCFPADEKAYPHALHGLRQGFSFHLDLGKEGVKINRVVVREAISYGECIASFSVIGDDKVMANGTWVGHKRILQSAPVGIRSAELVVTDVVTLGCVPRLEFFAVTYCPL